MNKYDAVELIWNYMKMNHTLEKSDLIVVFGSHDFQVAHRGAELILNEFAPKVIFSGGLGRITEGTWKKTEAEIFSEIAIEKGVPKNKIILENKSKNTGQNIEFTKKIIFEHKLDIKKIIVVHQPYMERRIYSAIKKQWNDVNLLVTSPQKNFFEYCMLAKKYGYDEDLIINIIVGDFQRMDIYYKKGFQIYQEIPSQIWTAYEKLLNIGYDKQIIK
jgi:uncharacterized SAM-binding protein YcdF (DUF218 family)